MAASASYAARIVAWDGIASCGHHTAILRFVAFRDKTLLDAVVREWGRPRRRPADAASVVSPADQPPAALLLVAPFLFLAVVVPS
ncbi:hypothetical protein DFH06DRAFT_1328202 [Mycena polygramma]|nr:hypothetical protein DFH06DRAFT_1328202 [Mycena polygramma]